MLYLNISNFENRVRVDPDNSGYIKISSMVFYLKYVEHLFKTSIAQMCRRPKFLLGESETFKQVTGTLAQTV